jgi:hypothetical protein
LKQAEKNKKALKILPPSHKVKARENSVEKNNQNKKNEGNSSEN